MTLDLRHWVNSGLMAFFFFVVGLEARREFDIGELRERRRVTLPLVAGLGGMVVPVLIYLAFNAGHGSAHGWGTAMSTDTAFALGMLALVGPRFPERLRSFMLTVVVVDDVAALVVIATVYTGHVWLRGAGLRRCSSSPVCWRCAPPASRSGPLFALLGRGALGGAPEVGGRPDPRRPRDGASDLRLPGVALRPRAGEPTSSGSSASSPPRSSRARPRSGCRRPSRRTSASSSSTTRGRAT